MAITSQISKQIQAISTHSTDWLVMTENSQPGQSPFVQKNKLAYKTKMTWLDNFKHFFGYGPAGYYTLVNRIQQTAHQALKQHVNNIQLFNQNLDALYKGGGQLSEGKTIQKIVSILNWESNQLDKLEKKFFKNAGLVSLLFFNIFSFVKNMPNQLSIMLHLKSEIVRPDIKRIFFAQLYAQCSQKGGLSNEALLLKQDSSGKAVALYIIGDQQHIVRFDPSNLSAMGGQPNVSGIQISIRSINNQRVLNFTPGETKDIKFWQGFIANLCYLENIHEVRETFAPFELTAKPSNFDNPIRIKDVQEYSFPYKQDLEKYKQIEDSISAPASYCKIENLVAAAHASF